MIKHEEKYFPRCKTQFECKVGSILLCQCTTVEISEEERDFIHGQYDDCLCAACMKELKAEYHNQLYRDKLKHILGVFYKGQSG